MLFCALRLTPGLATGAQELAAVGASVEHTLRGGDVTFHGPGQLVAYPVVNLRRLACGARAFVEGLEDVMAAVAVAHGVTATGRVTGAPGVWVDAEGPAPRKLGAVGVRISGGVSTHGCALNVCTDLSWFSRIVPCGIPDKARSFVAHTCRPPTQPWGGSTRGRYPKAARNLRG